MRNFYQAFIHLFIWGFKLAALFGHAKAKKILEGQQNWFERLKKVIPENRKIIWFHAASLGEFEQARPLIETYKNQGKDYFILLSFFSPSGYEVRKNYASADHVFYLPLDTQKNAAKLASLAKFELVVFVKYEFWFNHLKALKENGIKTVLISAIFRKNQLFFKWYGGWFRKQLEAFHHFFVQDQRSVKLLQKIGIRHCSQVGDSRFDQVLAIRKQAFHSSEIESFCSNEKVLIFGSSWEKEEEFAIRLSREKLDWKIIIAPHEIQTSKVNRMLTKSALKSIKWSAVNKKQDLSSYRFLVIDEIGMLSKLYRFATLAFIGGGFGKGIHNLAEAAVYGTAVIFGPKYGNFKEAKDLIECGGGFSVNNYSQFLVKLQELSHEKNRLQASINAKKYIESKSGASEKIAKSLRLD